MATRKVSLQPDRMTSKALFQRARTIVFRCRWAQGLNAAEREELLVELDAILAELQLRGVQLVLG